MIWPVGQCWQIRTPGCVSRGIPARLMTGMIQRALTEVIRDIATHPLVVVGASEHVHQR